MEKCAHYKKSPREESFVNDLDNRINRITGQLNGINKMIKDNRYCHDILIQIAAVESALKEVGFMILYDHMSTCVSEDIKNGDTASLKEAMDISKKLL